MLKRVKLNSGEIETYLVGETESLVRQVAEETAERAGDLPYPAASRIYSVTMLTNPDRVAARVYPRTTYAKRSNAKHNTLVKLTGAHK